MNATVRLWISKHQSWPEWIEWCRSKARTKSDAGGALGKTWSPIDWNEMIDPADPGKFRLAPTIRELDCPLVHRRWNATALIHSHFGFLSQLLCADTIVNYISESFLIWAWDMTHDTNKARWVALSRRRIEEHQLNEFVVFTCSLVGGQWLFLEEA